MPERSDLDRGHADVVIGSEHGVEFSAERADEDGVGGQGAGAVERLRGGRQDIAIFRSEHPRLTGVRVESAHRQAGGSDAPPAAERFGGDFPGGHDPIGGERRRHGAKRNVGRDQSHAQPVGGQHHDHVHSARQRREPLGVARVGIPREVKRVLLGGSSNDRVDVAPERKRDGAFNRGADDLAGLNCGKS